MNLKGLQKVIEKIGKGLPPNDDWMPALILEGKKEVSVFGFVGDVMGGDRAKDAVATQITKLIREFKPHTACFITTAWSIELGNEPASEAMTELLRQGKIRPSQHPDRIEIVSAYCYGEQGENEGEVLMIGYIQRFKNSHPKIKKWKILGDEGVTAEGRFPEAIQEGFKRAKGE